MAQHDYIISNQTFPNTRQDINNLAEAVATNNSGTSAPTTQYAGQFWIDTTTTTWTLYIHDGTDDIQFATIDTSANTVNFTDSALDVVTDTTPQLGGDLDLNSNDITGTGNINITGTATVTGLTSTGNIDVTGTITGTVADNSVGLKLISTDDDANVGPRINLERNSATPADGDSLGQIVFSGVNDNVPEAHTYAKIISKIQDASNATEDGILDFQTTVATSEGTSRIYIDSTGVTINDEGIDSDFRVESNNDTHCLFVDGGNDNVLIGTTSNVLFNATSGGGMLFENNGVATIARQSTTSTQPLLILNETGVDGDLAQFRKDGTTVGSIGNYSTNGTKYTGTTTAFWGGGDTGLYADGSSDYILPASPSTDSALDNTIDLGASGYRFKNLYLSGNVYLGGTGSANALDDYEEGTWTPSVGGGTVTVDTAIYRKIGSFVILQFSIENKSTSGMVNNNITGLPFTPADRSSTSSISHYNIFPYDNVVGLLTTTNITMLKTNANSGWTGAVFNNGSNNYLSFTVGYYVS